MALRAVQAGMRAGQGKPGQTVVKGGRCPAGSRVAGTAIVAKAAIVGVICRMAGIAVSRCTAEDSIDMAAFTRERDVCPGQFEIILIVIEGCRSPVFTGVTFSTAQAEVALMDIFHCMAGMAVVGGALKNSIGVTALTIQRGMFTGQFESK